MNETERPPGLDQYPEPLRDLMDELERELADLRNEVSKVGRNVCAAVRARAIIQRIRKDLGLRLRAALLAEKHRVYGSRESRRRRRKREQRRRK